MSAKTAVIGLDACDPVVATEAMAAGRMPHLASLVARGQRRSLVPPHGLYVGSIWPSFATGSGPAVHGIYSWRQFVPGAYATRKMRVDEAGGTPFWDALSVEGANVAIIDAPLSAPSKQLNGLQIVDWGSHDRWLPATSVGTNDFIVGRDRHPITVRCDHSARVHSPAELIEQLVQGAKAKADLSLDILRSDEWDLFLTVFSESHCAGHHLWKHHDTSHVDHDPEVATALGGDPLLDVYAELDSQLGRLLDELGDTTIFVILSHGFLPHYGGDHVLDEALVRIEHAIAPAPITRALTGAAFRIGDWSAKTVRAKLGAGDASVSPLNGARAFFQVPNNERFGGIRLNLAGREPRGFIDMSSNEGMRLVEQLEAELLMLRCPTSGMPLVDRVLHTDDSHAGPRRDHLPDLLVDWNWSMPIEGAVSPTIGIVNGRYAGQRSGDHQPSGEVIVVRPGSSMIDSGGGALRIEDLAPTIASTLGHQLADVDGIVAQDLIEPTA